MRIDPGARGAAAARLRGRPAFTADDPDMAAGFANQAAVAIELAEARAEQQRAAMLDERERIAADLHDHVIQRLFATGLSLHALAGPLGPGRAGRPGTGRDRRPRRHDHPDPHQHLRAAADPPGPSARAAGPPARTWPPSRRPALGFDPAVRFSGLLDTPARPDLAEDLRGGAPRGAEQHRPPRPRPHRRGRPHRPPPAGSPSTVRDDGTGLGATTRRSGLANLRRRAQHHGGTLTLTPRRPQRDPAVLVNPDHS